MDSAQHCHAECSAVAVPVVGSSGESLGYYSLTLGKLTPRRLTVLDISSIPPYPLGQLRVMEIGNSLERFANRG